MLPSAFQLIPEYREYVWGGQRLRPGTQTAEAWVVYEGNRIQGGPLAGRTLGEVVEQYGAGVLGEAVRQARGPRFPILIKLLDCFQWLSMQVHPDDQQAVALEGPGQNGKTEAWHILEAEQGAKIIAGFKPGTTAQGMEQATRDGSIEQLARYIPLTKGQTVFMPAGTLHALGPGLLVYEVQESSDITYRVFDWNRVATKGRVLHIEKSLAVMKPSASAEPIPEPAFADGEKTSLCQSEFFNLQVANSQTKSVSMDTEKRTFHALTVVEGTARFLAGQDEITIHQYDSLIVPSSTGKYLLEPVGGFRMLVASL
jgi:mannose-6-phosphate isomerase